MIDQLRPGMTKRQVIFVMGTPLVRDPFNQDRWDYVYTIKRGDGSSENKTLSIHFSDDKMTSFSTDIVPATTVKTEKDDIE